MPRANILRSVRQLHLYFGVFITPAILFFALTGALQTLGLHETNRDHPDYKPARWIVLMGQLHKKQTIVLPERRPAPPAVSAAPSSASAAPTPLNGQGPRPPADVPPAAPIKAPAASAAASPAATTTCGP